jgi:hypothetical protein
MGITYCLTFITVALRLTERGTKGVRFNPVISLPTQSKFGSISMVKRMAPVFIGGSVLYLPLYRIHKKHIFSAEGGSASGGES